MPDRVKQEMGASLRWASAGAFALALGVSPTSVAAQQDRQAQSVAERNAPEFTRMPIRVGTFNLFPSIELDTEYNDNIFALPNNEVDDVVFNLRPQLVLTKATPTSETRVQLLAGIRRFLDISTENSEQFTGSISTRQGIGSGTEWRLQARAAQNFEQRREIESFNEAGEPVKFLDMSAGGGVTQDLGALRLSVDGRARAVRYEGSFEQNGVVFDLAQRDFEVYEGRARASYQQSPNQEIYVEVTADSRRFNPAPLFQNGLIINLDGIDRSSRGGRVELGYRRQVTELLYLDLRAGYFLQDFDDPTALNADGVAFQADLLWNATPLTSVRFSGVRQVDASLNPQFNGLIRSEGRVQVEHELQRNIILIGRAEYANFDQIDSPLDGDQLTFGAQAEYLIGRSWRLTLDGERFDRNGFLGFTQNIARLGVQYSF